jgi:hypothetical protein
MMAKMGHNEKFLACLLPKKKVVPSLLSLFNKHIYEMIDTFMNTWPIFQLSHLKTS